MSIFNVRTIPPVSTPELLGSFVLFRVAQEDQRLAVSKFRFKSLTYYSDYEADNRGETLPYDRAPMTWAGILQQCAIKAEGRYLIHFLVSVEGVAGPVSVDGVPDGAHIYRFERAIEPEGAVHGQTQA